ncbi:MAG: DUF2271 domain-containing protein [Myxococcales bacterium]|nr:DUF2271 domain-containing protein [Myxococcales bacterium]
MSIAAALAFAGCYEPGVGRDDLQDALAAPVDLFDDGGTVVPRDGGGGGGPDAAAGCDTSPLSALRIVVRTTPFGGRYQPKNIGAIWIETASGQYVKTVKRWANRRLRYLTRYNAASGGDVTDAITGATLTSHITHDVTWNLTDRTHCEVPAGNYRVVMELTDQDAAGASVVLPFTKGTSGAVSMPAQTAQFHDLVLDLH